MDPVKGIFSSDAGWMHPPKTSGCIQPTCTASSTITERSRREEGRGGGKKGGAGGGEELPERQERLAEATVGVGRRKSSKRWSVQGTAALSRRRNGSCACGWWSRLVSPARRQPRWPAPSSIHAGLACAGSSVQARSTLADLCMHGDGRVEAAR